MREEESSATSARERALRVATAALHLVGEANEERELMKGLCDLLVEEAGYRLAWIGLAERAPERVVEPVAWTGDEDYVRAIGARWDEVPRGQGPVGRATREGRSVAINAAATDATFAPWREAARARGYAACCCVPLRMDGEVIGVTAVYAARENAFDAHEISVLEELVRAAERGVELFRARVATRAALEEARAARDQLRAIYDASPDAIFVHTADGRVLDVNDNVLELFGMDRAAVLKAAPELLLDGSHTLDDALEHVARAVRDGRDQFQWTAVRPDGNEAPVEIRLRRLPDFRGGKDEPAVVAVVRDVTEQRRLEAQVLEGAKLESLASFAGGVAHDFNNFLTAVLGALSLATRELDERHPVRQLLDDAIEGASRARGLTRQLLAYARGGASVPTVFPLRPLIEQTARLALAGSAVSTRLEIAGELWHLRADRDQIAQVFHNLFLNAAQAMPTGELLVRASNLRIETAEPELEAGRYLRVEVKDRGPGIEPEHLPRIFDPFFTTKHDGTGLGLPTAFAVVRRHGGHLAVESRVGEGATFVVTLPACDAERARAQRDVSPAANALRVLVLEDEDTLRRVLSRMLEQLGHEGIEAAHGERALELARAERDAGRRIDVALLDLTIRGGRGGREILSELRAILPAPTAIVAMSGYSEVAPSEVAFDAFLAKPFGFERFDAMLRQAMRRDHRT